MSATAEAEFRCVEPAVVVCTERVETQHQSGVPRQVSKQKFGLQPHTQCGLLSDECVHVILSPPLCNGFLMCRYRVWILVCKNWTEFVRDRKQWRTVKLSATSHSVLLSVAMCEISTADTAVQPSPDERRLERKVWRGWCEYQRRRREKKVSCGVARQWHLAHVLRSGCTSTIMCVCVNEHAICVV